MSYKKQERRYGMEISSDRTDNILTISLSGRLDAFGAKQLDDALKKFIGTSIDLGHKKSNRKFQ